MFPISEPQSHASRAINPRDAILSFPSIEQTPESTCIQDNWRVCYESATICSTCELDYSRPFQANSLQFLDLSQNPLDKKSVEYIVAALTTAPEPGLVSLRLDECSLRPGALEVLCE